MSDKAVTKMVDTVMVNMVATNGQSATSKKPALLPKPQLVLLNRTEKKPQSTNLSVNISSEVTSTKLVTVKEGHTAELMRTNLDKGKGDNDSCPCDSKKDQTPTKPNVNDVEQEMKSKPDIVQTDEAFIRPGVSVVQESSKTHNESANASTTTTTVTTPNRIKTNGSLATSTTTTMTSSTSSTFIMSPSKINGEVCSSSTDDDQVFTFDHVKDAGHCYVNLSGAGPRSPIARRSERSASSSTSSNSVDTVINKADDDDHIHQTMTSSSSVGSAQACHRLLIGTGMMLQRRKPSPIKINNYVNVPAMTATTTMTTSTTTSSSFRLKREAQVLRLSTLRQQLKSLLRSESDFQQALSVERSLLLAESEAEQKLLQRGEMRLRALNDRLTSFPSGARADRVASLTKVLLEKKKEYMEQEDLLKDLKEQVASKGDDGEYKWRVKDQSLKVESLRKVYEDVEFSHMEEVAQMSVEKEELNKEISDLRLVVRSHEVKIEGFGSQLQKMLQELQVCSIDVARRRAALESAIKKESEALASMDSRAQCSSELKDYVNVALKSESRLSTSSSEEEQPENGESTSSKLVMEELNKSLEKDLHRLSIATESNKSASLSLDRSILSASTEDGSDCSSSLSFYTSPMTTTNRMTSTVGRNCKAKSSSCLMPCESNHLGSLSLTTPRRRRHPRTSTSSSLRPERPLTRYLPVTSSNFDLRAHIESAGHPIDTLKELVLNASACRGYLRKLNCKTAGIKRWQRRWFVFDRIRKVLVYYKNKREEKPREVVDFNTIEDVYVDHLDGCRRRFCVKTTRRTFRLMASSPELMRVWVDVVFTGAEAYQQRFWIPQ